MYNWDGNSLMIKNLVKKIVSVRNHLQYIFGLSVFIINLAILILAKHFYLIKCDFIWILVYGAISFIYIVLLLIIKEDKHKFWSQFLLIFSILLSLLLFFIFENARYLYFFNILAIYIFLSFSRILFYYLLLLGEYILIVFIHSLNLQRADLFVDMVVVVIQTLVLTFIMIFQQIFLQQKQQINNYTKQLDDVNLEINRQTRRLKEELKVARQIQQKLIPKRMPKTEKLEFSAIYAPAEEVSGDFYDFVEYREPELYGIFISDVSGHGAPAALIASMIKTLLDTAGENKTSPQLLLSYINDNLVGKTSGNFLTAFYAIYNSKTKKLLYSKASHTHPIILRKNELFELDAKGKFLGVFEDLLFEEKEVTLEKGDKLFFYTDGLTEAVNPNGAEYHERFYEILKDKFYKPIYQLVEAVYNDLLIFCETNQFEDDVCIVGMEVKN